ncbi:PBP1A family penicillin-binding protein [Paenibacillus albidus]|uniref:transglycosylase domain-containing protein n=1 Tax=Paenibacillus albidus TaxID=2041023 RepID=UPI001BE6B8F8|nr:PBP1A family penicillin-binding protein [Paenibacillus albidus]MBT2290247.1 PBP1A family penicillin-binding protein [Paenibacillus albidus]
MSGGEKRSWRGLLLRIGYVGFDVGVLLAVLLLAFLLYIHLYGGLMLSRHPEKLILQESSQITASDGTVLRRIPLPESGYRITAQLEEMPQLLIDTFLAVEDRRFYSHQGLDYRGMARAFLNNTVRMKISEGGSSITQQLARGLYLDRGQNLLRKLNEASIAVALEKRLSKKEILQLYLNQIYMGQGQYGVQTAAERYFGVSNLKDLDIWQIAALAATPKGPSLYNPAEHSELSTKRRELVLRIMHQQGLITYEQMAAAMKRSYQPPAAVKAEVAGASYIDASLQEAVRITGKSREELQTGGYTIVTGMNIGAQRAMEQTFSRAEFFPPDGQDRQVEAAMVMIDHRTGEVAALMGGRNPGTGSLNRAVIDARQPGSAFKPIIVYGPALESGRYSPGSLLQDRKNAYGTYSPANLNGIYRGQVSMRMALQQSINAPAVWLLKQVGISYARGFAAKLGLVMASEDNHLPIALGGLHTGFSPLKMAQAYSVFANRGILNEAHMVRSIRDNQGRVLYTHVSLPQQVISLNTAAGLTTMLRQAVNEGTGKRARLNIPVAGKTGTTQLDLPGVSSKANRDLWFAGFASHYTAAVWIGFDRTDKDNYMTAGSGVAAALFAQIIGKALGSGRE